MTLKPKLRQRSGDESPLSGDDDRLLTADEIENEGGGSKSKLAKDRCYGKGIPYVKLGRLVRYRLGDYREYIARNRRQSTSEMPLANTAKKRRGRERHL